MTGWTIDTPQRITIEDPVTALDASLVSGRLTVVAADGPSRIEVTEVSHAPLVVEHVDGVLRIRHPKPPRRPGLLWWLLRLRRRYRAEVSLAVPDEVRAHLRLISGSVVASGLRAGADVHVTNGRITLLGLVGRVAARVVSGTIEALGVGGDLTMETTSGEITLADSAAGRVHARTVSGAVTCDLDNPRDGDIRVETVSGEITVRVREDSDLDVDLRATSGRVSAAFPRLTGQGRGASQYLHGTLGAGTGRLSASAVSGNISLLSRPVATDDEELT